MKVTTTKSKNSESFYITMSYVNNEGKSTSKTIRKLGTLKELSRQLATDRDGVLAWAKEQARIETEKYKKQNQTKTVLIPFHADRLLDYHQQKLFKGGYLFPQAVYYQLGFERICRKIRDKHHFHYDINAILSDLIYTRILEPCSKRASYRAAMDFLEPPSYQEHDVYRALDVLADECDMIQAEVYKNSNFVIKRMDGSDYTNYYFEIEQVNACHVFYKEEPYTTKKLDQRLIITYSPKYAAYQETAD